MVHHALKASKATRQMMRLARNPADPMTMLDLALALDAEGNKNDAGAAMQQALRLAPGDGRTLTAAAAYYLRAGDDAQALVTLRRAVDASSGEVNDSIWDIFMEALDADRHRDFFAGLARDNPAWWGTFFRLACAGAGNVGALQAMYAMRVDAAKATVDERRCIIDRLQRDGYWANAYRVWLSGLPPDQRTGGNIFNGDFRLPLSNVGFDWRVPQQQGVVVATQSDEDAKGRGALKVAFVRQRYGGPPVYQYLLLSPGPYRLEGRGRADLESWLGLQWGIYCNDPPQRQPRQLARSVGFTGPLSWRDFRVEFVVPKDCPVQLLRLELANPNRDASAPGAVVVRLQGTVWFDDLRVQALE